MPERVKAAARTEVAPPPEPKAEAPKVEPAPMPDRVKAAARTEVAPPPEPKAEAPKVEPAPMPERVKAAARTEVAPPPEPKAEAPTAIDRKWLADLVVRQEANSAAIPERASLAARSEAPLREDRKIDARAKIASLSGAPDAKVPERLRELSPARVQQMALSVGGRFELYDQNGNQRAEPIIHTSFGAPRPAGVFV
jgi:hypothetical protein